MSGESELLFLKGDKHASTPFLAFLSRGGSVSDGRHGGLCTGQGTQCAGLQAGRVAKARALKSDQVRDLIQQNTDPADLGILGDPGVNVLRLNLALDAIFARFATRM